MKLVSFERNGKGSFGAVVDGGVVDLHAALDGRYADLKALIAADAFAEAAQVLLTRKADYALDSVDLLPVIPNPNKIVCIGLNYAEHVRETGKTVTESPALFLRMTESQVAHGKAILRPPESDRLDFEGEIAVVIGKGGRRISEADSWNHIAGYSCYNDGSVRDWQVATSQWTPGKNFYRTGGFGPWLVTADEIAPNQVMTLITRLNGQEMQRATTEMMIHSIPRQIAYISTFIPLEAGDVIVTGTPGGIGNKRTPPIFMKPGDVVEIDIDAVGILRNTIADDV
jgi:2-keto-4-pentenoate hydratase/2-oxohepta-3-ene-1,7-dioic acid hydratase in catechol pathway